MRACPSAATRSSADRPVLLTGRCAGSLRCLSDPMGMSRTTQLFDAAAVLSDRLTTAGITHAFTGNFETIALGGPGRADTEVSLLVTRMCPPPHPTPIPRT